MELAPFHLLEPEDQGGSWSLFLTATDSFNSRSVFEDANRHSGGYGWEGVALYFLEEVLDESTASQILLDCENDTFVANSRDSHALHRLAALMVPLARDGHALAQILRIAPIDGWTRQFLR